MMNQTNQNDNGNENDNALAAWEEWKEKCFVILVSTDGERGDLRSILRRLIHTAFKKKFDKMFEKVCPSQADELMTDPYRLGESEDKQFQKDFIDNYWSSEFDQGIINTQPPEDFMTQLEEETGRAAELVKCYKDFVWYKKEHSSDPPLVVIQGKLIGPKSAINGIAERYVENNHNTVWLGYDLNKKRGKHDGADEKNAPTKKSETPHKDSVNVISFQDSVGNSEDCYKTYADTIPDKTAADYTSQVSEEELEKELESFSREDIALILAKMAKLTTDPVTQEFIGWGHSKISYYWNNHLKKKCLKYNILSDSKTISLLKKRIESEKGSEEFLSIVEPALQSRIERMEKGEEE